MTFSPQSVVDAFSSSTLSRDIANSRSSRPNHGFIRLVLGVYFFFVKVACVKLTLDDDPHCAAKSRNIFQFWNGASWAREIKLLLNNSLGADPSDLLVATAFAKWIRTDLTQLISPSFAISLVPIKVKGGGHRDTH